MQTGAIKGLQELECPRRRSMPYKTRTAMQDITHTAVYDNHKIKCVERGTAQQ